MSNYIIDDPVDTAGKKSEKWSQFTLWGTTLLPLVAATFRATFDQDHGFGRVNNVNSVSVHINTGYDHSTRDGTVKSNDDDYDLNGVLLRSDGTVEFSPVDLNISR